MARQITWTPQAQEEYRLIVSHLLDVFGDKVTEDYTDRLAKVIDNIALLPDMGRMHPQMSAIRQVVVRPHTVVCYLVFPAQITVVNLLDSRSERR